jgi:hypothetical protein
MTSILKLLEIFQPVFLFDEFGSSDYRLVKNIFLLLLLIFIVYALVKVSSRNIKVVHSHWHSMLETRPFTPEEFYEALQKQIAEKEVEKLSISRISHSEAGFVISANRTYLRVKFREYMMDICAAPFAKEEFFVSWWLGDAGFTFRDFLISIPVIGRLFSRREKTFYELDTEIMFKETVARSVKDTIEQLTETKGMRLPDLSDWRGTALQFNK